MILMIYKVQSQVVKRIQIPTNEKGYNTYLYEKKQDKTNQLNLVSLLINKDKFRFRFWTSNQVVDIWTSDFKVFNGEIINFITEIFREKHYSFRASRKVLKQKVKINSILSKGIYELINEISSIPSMNAIEGWNLWRDSQESYVFEISTPISYTFKEYSCADIQDSKLIEAEKISVFINEIFLQLKLKDVYSNFVNSLKNGMYENDNKVRIDKLSKKQLKQLKISEPYYEYLKTVNDSLN